MSRDARVMKITSHKSLSWPSYSRKQGLHSDTYYHSLSTMNIHESVWKPWNIIFLPWKIGFVGFIKLWTPDRRYYRSLISLQRWQADKRHNDGSSDQRLPFSFIARTWCTKLQIDQPLARKLFVVFWHFFTRSKTAKTLSENQPSQIKSIEWVTVGLNLSFFQIETERYFWKEKFLSKKGPLEVF